MRKTRKNKKQVDGAWPTLVADPRLTSPYVEYNPNNSGGHWWLKDNDWIALEKSGWYVMWGGMEFCGLSMVWAECPNPSNCYGHRKFESYHDVDLAPKGRWLGAAARYAFKAAASLDEAIADWQCITKQNPTEPGCICCGPPHMFTMYGPNHEFISYYSPNDPEYAEDKKQWK